MRLLALVLATSSALAGTTLEGSSFVVNDLEVRELSCDLDKAPFLGLVTAVAALSEQKPSLDACAPEGGAWRVTWTWDGGRTHDVEVLDAHPARTAECASASLAEVRSDLVGTCTAVVLGGEPTAADAAAAKLAPHPE